MEVIESQPNPNLQKESLKTSRTLRQQLFGWTDNSWFQRLISPEVRSLRPALLKRLLLEATRNPKFVVKNFPKALDLGEFGYEAERLIKLSSDDPSHPEFLSLVLLDKAGKVLMLSTPIRGDCGSAKVPEYPDKRRLMLMHSHGDVDSPFSDGDLVFMFIPPKLQEAITCELVVTPTMKLLMFRTENTPTTYDANKALDMIMDFATHPALDEENELWSRNFEEVGGNNLGIFEPIPATEKTKKGMAWLSNKKMFALTDFAQKYNLKFYSCPLGKNIAYPIH